MSTASSTQPTLTSSHGDVPPSARLNEPFAVGASAKDVRAHEHARHLVKERQEHVLAKERKEKAAATRVVVIKAARGGRGSKLVRRLSTENWDGDGLQLEARQPRASVTALTAPIDGGSDSPTIAADKVAPLTDLTLADVISSRLRKPKAKQLDFEVIPPIRSVIALDDVDVDVDEAWEYITRASVNDGSAWKGKSYAQAVASAM